MRHACNGKDVRSKNDGMVVERVFEVCICPGVLLQVLT